MNDMSDRRGVLVVRVGDVVVKAHPTRTEASGLAVANTGTLNLLFGNSIFP